MRAFVLVAVGGLLWGLATAPPITAHPFEPLSKPGSTLDKAAGGLDAASLASIDCGSAIDVQLGETVCGDNLTAPNHVDSYGCSPWPETGGEVVYRLNLLEAAFFEIRLDAACDLDLAILSGCDADLDCLLVDNSGIRTNVPVTGEYFVVVDGYNGAACSFCLYFVETQPPDPPFIDPAACATAQAVSCVARTWNGTTCGAGNDVEYTDCSMFHEAGEDSWYRIALDPGGAVFISAVMPDADVALWLLDDCGGDFQCLDYADRNIAGSYETVAHSNNTGAQQTLFLVVDSFIEPVACATYEVEITQCFGGVLSAETTSWSTLKSTFVEPHDLERR